MLKGGMDRRVRFQPFPHIERLSLTRLDELSTDFNDVVRQTPEIDRFCSSTYWTIPAHQAFANVRPVWIRRTTEGFAAMAVGMRYNAGPVLEPLECIWGAACPWVGRNPDSLSESLLPEILALRRSGTSLMLTGLVAGGELFRAVIRQFRPYLEIRLGASTRCFRASLQGGPDAFLGRRSSGFRTSLRRACRVTRAADVTFEYHSRFHRLDDVRALYERILAIENNSWKGMTGTGLAEPTMRQFYAHMLTRLWPQDAIRVVIAQHRGRDIGFVMGALMDRIYRGLQVSFDQEFAALSLGNVLQWEIIQRLCTEECDLYDLGVEVEYKERWGEEVFETVLLMLE